jgi:hypothetical protein
MAAINTDPTLSSRVLDEIRGKAAVFARSVIGGAKTEIQKNG